MSDVVPPAICEGCGQPAAEVDADGLGECCEPRQSTAVEKAEPRMRDPLPFEAMAEHGEHGDVSALLWFINRAAFHPIGYALAFHYKPCERCEGDGSVQEFGQPVECPTCKGTGAGDELEGWSLIGDGLAGDEPFAYTEELDNRGFALFRSFLANLPPEEET